MKTYHLLLNFNSYTGNFDNEFSAYCLGLYPNNEKTYQLYHKSIDKYKDINDNLSLFYDKYGSTATEICGNFSGECDCIKVFLKNKSIVKEILKRIPDFIKQLKSDKFLEKNIKFIGYELFEIETIKKKIDL